MAKLVRMEDVLHQRVVGQEEAVVARVSLTGRTGVEMEALTAVSVACLTIYDMLKAKARGMRIEAIELVEKEGGASGTWRRESGA